MELIFWSCNLKKKKKKIAVRQNRQLDVISELNKVVEKGGKQSLLMPDLGKALTKQSCYILIKVVQVAGCHVTA